MIFSRDTDLASRDFLKFPSNMVVLPESCRLFFATRTEHVRDTSHRTLWITLAAYVITFHRNQECGAGIVTQLPGRVGSRISCFNDTPTSDYDGTPRTSFNVSSDQMFDDWLLTFDGRSVWFVIHSITNSNDL